MINLSVIFEEGPIARCYLEALKRLNFNINEIIYLGSDSLIFKDIYIYYNNIKNNSYAINFLLSKKNESSINEIEKFFNLDKNFFFNAYLKYNKIKNVGNFKYIKNKDVNSKQFIDKINSSNSKFFLNTSKKIYKNLNFNNNKKIIHIHPAYLPNIRGADGSFWSIKLLNKFSSTIFLMNEGIDKGDIIYREKIDLKNFSVFKKINLESCEKFWFCFIDPAIRCHNLFNFVKKKIDIFSLEKKNTDGNYYSFMKNNEKLEILKRILII